ncbi:hypothetical protein IWX90DRAFT_484857 [Phyllosticta citrichinensis]|uniref:Uncharacterized protein n=1 Tax=Phyllosticta citrichinensis TaxID=1130410 RepID=A0ABR1Y0N3_9PEZI
MVDEHPRSNSPSAEEEPMSEASTSQESTSQKSWTEESTTERSLSEEEEDLPNAPALSDDEIKANVVEQSHRETFWDSDEVPAVEGVLESLSISNYDLEVGGYTICDGRKNQAPVMTLLVRVHGCAKNAGGSWSEAVVQIARLLPTMALGDEAVTAVEICERGWPLLAPIEYKDHVLDVWESVLAPAVVEILDQPPPIPWWTISLARFASFASLPPGPVTLIITAIDAAD